MLCIPWVHFTPPSLPPSPPPTRVAGLGCKPKEVFPLEDARQVEILARCCRVWVDSDTLDKNAVKLADKVRTVNL